MKQINLIMAIDSNLGIACSSKNSIPWSIREDMQFFKKITSTTTDKTKKNAILMGKNTYLSLPKITDRMKVVISSNKLQTTDHQFTNCKKALDFLMACDDIESIFIIGGKRIYETCIKYCRTLYVTRIKADFMTDVIPAISLDYYKLIDSVTTEVHEKTTNTRMEIVFEMYDNENIV